MNDLYSLSILSFGDFALFADPRWEDDAIILIVWLPLG